MDYDDRDSSESESDNDTILDAKYVELALRSLSSSERDHVNILEKDLPIYASQLLTTVTRCKQLCCYVKRVFFLILSKNNLFLFRLFTFVFF